MSEFTEQLSEKFHDLVDSISSLSEQQRNLFINSMLTRVDGTLEQILGLLEHGETDGARATIVYLLSAVQTTGLANQITRDGHKKWTADSDRQSQACVEKWIDMAQSTGRIALENLDVPQEVKDRLEAGTATDHDRQIVIEAAQRLTGAKQARIQDEAPAVATDSAGHAYGGQYL